MHTIVHFEIPADNLPRATDFYRRAFGWKVEPASGFPDYHMAGPGEGGVNGAIMKRPEGMAGPLVYVSSDDVAATVRTITGLGATIVTPRSPVPGIGWFAVFRDPEGNSMALFQSDPNAK